MRFDSGMSALPDGQVAQQQLAKAEVDIWPMATGYFEAFSGGTMGAEGSITLSVLPDVKVQLFDLCPNSNTTSRIGKDKWYFLEGRKLALRVEFEVAGAFS